ncbi:hypothetical protein ABVW88_21180, partial [Enterobacter cloacae subsp. cloacae]|uniref:hypothetical protein n=1 Tax=Enterobacter cloacae TaxID=550 RepID=UPI00345B0EC9
VVVKGINTLIKPGLNNRYYSGGVIFYLSVFNELYGIYLYQDGRFQAVADFCFFPFTTTLPHD